MKLIDFGSCVLWDTSRPAPLQTGRESEEVLSYVAIVTEVLTDRSRTDTGFFGTSTFAAPEVFAEQPYDGEKAEIWALGVILSLLLTGGHPFSSGEDARIGFLAPLKVPVSPLAFDCIRRCLTVDVARRISLAELLSHPWILECAAI